MSWKQNGCRESKFSLGRVDTAAHERGGAVSAKIFVDDSGKSTKKVPRSANGWQFETWWHHPLRPIRDTIPKGVQKRPDVERHTFPKRELGTVETPAPQRTQHAQHARCEPRQRSPARSARTAQEDDVDDDENDVNDGLPGRSIVLWVFGLHGEAGREREATGDDEDYITPTNPDTSCWRRSVLGFLQPPFPPSPPPFPPFSPSPVRSCSSSFLIQNSLLSVLL